MIVRQRLRLRLDLRQPRDAGRAAAIGGNDAQYRTRNPGFRDAGGGRRKSGFGNSGVQLRQTPNP